MSNGMGITLDGRTYDVRIVYNTLTRAFELAEGENAGAMLSGRYERDLIGTGYSYQLAVEPNPLNRADYDAFYEAITAPTPTHTVVMPYGQTTITFTARVVSGQDVFGGTVGGKKLWRGLTVDFIANAPQRTV